MRIAVFVLSITLSASMGFIFGRTVGVDVILKVVSNSCNKLGGVTIRNKAYICSPKSN